MKKASLFAAAALSLAFVASASDAQAAGGDAKGFGEKSQLIVSADRLVPFFSFVSASVTETRPNNVELTRSQSGSGFSFLFGRSTTDDISSVPINVHTIPRVGFDFTVIPKLTLGVAFAAAFGLGGTVSQEVIDNNVKVTREQDAPTITAFGVAPRVGYIIPFHEYLAFWPRGGFSFYSVSAKSDTVNPVNNTTTTTSITDTNFALDLDPQFVITPVEHFFLQMGPVINIPLTGSRSGESTTGSTTTSVSSDSSLFHFGLQLGLGGYINL